MMDEEQANQRYDKTQQNGFIRSAVRPSAPCHPQTCGRPHTSDFLARMTWSVAQTGPTGLPPAPSTACSRKRIEKTKPHAGGLAA
jgi:hypothetical protein